jgi:hypothetical protein
MWVVGDLATAGGAEGNMWVQVGDLATAGAAEGNMWVQVDGLATAAGGVEGMLVMGGWEQLPRVVTVRVAAP